MALSYKEANFLDCQEKFQMVKTFGVKITVKDLLYWIYLNRDLIASGQGCFHLLSCTKVEVDFDDINAPPNSIIPICVKFVIKWLKMKYCIIGMLLKHHTYVKSECLYSII